MKKIVFLLSLLTVACVSEQDTLAEKWEPCSETCADDSLCFESYDGSMCLPPYEPSSNVKLTFNGQDYAAYQCWPECPNCGGCNQLRARFDTNKDFVCTWSGQDDINICVYSE